jgi:hypothetical protein
MSAPEQPKVRMPLARVVELLLTKPNRGSESVEISRNAKGDVQFTVTAVAHDDETLEQAAARGLAVADTLDRAHALSRAQLIARQADPTAPTPKGATK